MSITIAQMNTAIHDTFEDNLTLIDFFQDYNDLSEGLANTPLLQIYWNSLNTVAENSATDRNTFGSSTQKPLRQKRYIFRVDLYCDPRANLDSVFVQMLPIVDEINNVLEAQDAKPYFGLDGIKSFTFTCERGNIEYGSVNYPVVQWTIELSVF